MCYPLNVSFGLAGRVLVVALGCGFLREFGRSAFFARLDYLVLVTSPRVLLRGTYFSDDHLYLRICLGGFPVRLRAFAVPSLPLHQHNSEITL